MTVLEVIDTMLVTLGDPDAIGANQTWVGKGYAKSDLIKDLRKVKEKLCDKPS